MQVKAQWDKILHSSNEQKLKDLKIPRIGEDMGQWEFLYSSGGSVNFSNHFGNSVAISSKVGEHGHPVTQQSELWARTYPHWRTLVYMFV